MPGATAGLADVGAGDPHPLEFLGRLQQCSQQFAVVGLERLALGQGRACLGNPLRQPVANRLQLAEVEHPRGGGNRLDPMRDRRVAEGLAEDFRQLRLEATDLAAQLEPRPTLVDPDPEPGELLSIQQCRHFEEV